MSAYNEIVFIFTISNIVITGTLSIYIILTVQSRVEHNIDNFINKIFIFQRRLAKQFICINNFKAHTKECSKNTKI